MTGIHMTGIRTTGIRMTGIRMTGIRMTGIRTAGPLRHRAPHAPRLRGACVVHRGITFRSVRPSRPA